MEPDMSSWLLVQPYSFQDSREAARGPRGAPGSVWEGPPGRTRRQEGQGTATGLALFPCTPKAPSLPSALRVNILACPAAEATAWDRGCSGVTMKRLAMGLEQVPGVVAGLPSFVPALLCTLCGLGQVLPLPWLP